MSCRSFLYSFFFRPSFLLPRRMIAMRLWLHGDHRSHSRIASPCGLLGAVRVFVGLGSRSLLCHPGSIRLSASLSQPCAGLPVWFYRGVSRYVKGIIATPPTHATRFNSVTNRARK